MVFRLASTALVLAACGASGAGSPEVVTIPAASDGGAPLVVTSASASSSPPPVDAKPDVAKARTLFQEGKMAFDKADYALALDRFRAAYQTAPRPEVLYDIGRTLEMMGRRHEAADVYEDYLHSDLSHIDRMSMEMRIQTLRSQP